MDSNDHCLFGPKTQLGNHCAIHKTKTFMTRVYKHMVLQLDFGVKEKKRLQQHPIFKCEVGLRHIYWKISCCLQVVRSKLRLVRNTI